VEKEGFNIIKEMEFSASTANSAHSWITLVNVSVRIQDTGKRLAVNSATRGKENFENMRLCVKLVFANVSVVGCAQL